MKRGAGGERKSPGRRSLGEAGEDLMTQWTEVNLPGLNCEDLGNITIEPEADVYTL